jgi:predicted hydrolase (HD superfamily)
MNNSKVRLYKKLDKVHKNIMAKIENRQNVKSLKNYVEYKQLFRRIVEVENKDANYMFK